MSNYLSNKTDKIKTYFDYIVIPIIIFFITLIIYIITLQPRLIPGETSWYALFIPKMQVLPPPGYPLYSLISKLFTLIPIGNIAYKLNLLSALFGSLSIIILFFLIQKIVKNRFIGIICALSFAFILPFWNIANRIQTDTLNIFFILLVILSAVNYNENPNTKNLYFFIIFFSTSLLNSQVNLFFMFAFLLYVIFVAPENLKNKKVIFISILVFIVPLFLNSYVYIRSIQGYGSIKSLKDFIYYISGRTSDGFIYMGDTYFKNRADVLRVFIDYLKFFYKNYGFYFLITSIIGLIYSFFKNIKFAFFSLLAIVSNLYVLIQYIYGPTFSILLPIYLILIIYNSFFFLLITDLILIFLSKINILKNKSYKFKKNIKIIFIAFLFIIFLFQPIGLFINNFSDSNNSKVDDAYIIWSKIIDKLEKGSYFFVQTYSGNIGAFINDYEKQNKNIKLILNNDERYSIEKMHELYNSGNIIYVLGNENNLNMFNLKSTDINFFYKKIKENLNVKLIASEVIIPEIKYEVINPPKKIGDYFSIELKLANTHNKKIKIDSIELQLPEIFKILSVDRSGYFNMDPGYSRKKFMWVSDLYILEPGKEANMILNLKILKYSEEPVINFRVMIQGNAVECNIPIKLQKTF